MPELMSQLGNRLDLLKEYFLQLDALFTMGSRGSAKSFFMNPYYADQKKKLATEVDVEGLLDYFFRYDNSMMMYSSDFLVYLILSRLSWAIFNAVDVKKSELKKGRHREYADRMKEINRFLLRFVNILLSLDIVYPNKKNDTENGYDKIFPNIKVDIVEHFLSNLDNNTLRSIAEAMGLSQAMPNELTAKYLDSVTDYFWKTAPALIPKTKGLSEELFVYYYLNNRRSGYYIIPLLLHQRFYSSLFQFQETIEKFVRAVEGKSSDIMVKAITDFLSEYRDYNFVAVPPDYLVLRKGRIFGLECGRGKEEQIVNFSAITGVPTIFVDAWVYLGESSHGFGLKCDRCYHPFLLCDEFVSREVQGTGRFDELRLQKRSCVKICGSEKAKTCRNAVITMGKREARAILTQEKKYESYYHFACLPDKAKGKVDVNKIVPPIPFVNNLDKLEIGFK